MSDYAPFSYDQINLEAGTVSPSNINAYNNASFAYWLRTFFQRAMSTIDLNLIPEWTDDIKSFIYYVLFKRGFGVVASEPEFGTFFQPGSTKGINFYYQPNQAIVSNPMLNKTYTIGTDCEILKLTPDWMGIWDILRYYAAQASNLDNCINVSLINGKYPYIFGAKSKGSAQAIKKMLDQVNKGEPAIVYDQRILDDTISKDEPWQYLDLQVKDHYMLPQQLIDLQTIINAFDTEIGIPTVPYQKKERMVQSEAESKQVESTARITTWIRCLNESFDKINRMFGTNMSASMTFKEGDVSNNE